MIETFFTAPGYVVAGAYSEYNDMIQPIVGLAECRKLWAGAKPAEKQQILAFVEANTEKREVGKGGKPGKLQEPYGAWGLAVATNLDTGRKFLTAALFLDSKGLTPNQIRGVVGLKPVKGGDKVRKLPEPKPVGGLKPSKPLAGGQPARISLGKIAKGKHLHGTAKGQVLMSREQAKRAGLVAAVKIQKPKQAVKPPLPKRKGKR